jgi:Motility quorum-sensing regulator, toxin of MqsA
LRVDDCGEGGGFCAKYLIFHESPIRVIFACGKAHTTLFVARHPKADGMTTHANHRVWQDVYHATWREKSLYVKFQQAEEYFVVSFKEL